MEGINPARIGWGWVMGKRKLRFKIQNQHLGRYVYLTHEDRIDIANFCADILDCGPHEDEQRLRHLLFKVTGHYGSVKSKPITLERS